MTANLNGWLLIDKPIDISSAGVTNFIKKILRTSGIKSKIGHAGTLDVAASGLLLIAIGEATKTMPYAMDLGKEYVFTIKWGEDRDTLDAEGKVIATSDVLPNKADIMKILPSFIGEISQVPPQYSALHINGQRAYDLARAGVEFTIKARDVKVYALELVNYEEGMATFRVESSKGFYVRSIARDIAAQLGACGYVSYLRRTKINKFSVKDAISLAIIEKMWHSTENSNLVEFIKPKMLSICSVLDDILVQNISPLESKKLQYGQAIELQIIAKEGETIILLCDELLVAIATAENGWLHPKRVINY